MSMNLTCVLGVVDEDISLIKTIDILIDSNRLQYSLEIILIIAPFATKESRRTAIKLADMHSQVTLVEQKDKGIGGAYSQGFKEAQGNVVVLMSSDLETDPKKVRNMVELLEVNKDYDIVAVSRWLQPNSFVGYSKILKFLNYIFQKIIQLLYHSDLTDFTYAFRAYRKNVIKDIVWTETSHSFFLESLLRPIKNGAKVLEIPGNWTARTEGKRHISRASYFYYVRLAFKLRFNGE